MGKFGSTLEMTKEFDEAYDFLNSKKIDTLEQCHSIKSEEIKSSQDNKQNNNNSNNNNNNKNKNKINQSININDSIIKQKLGKIYHKVDIRVSTILCGIYFLNFIDKSLLNYSAVMGIKDKLKPNSNQFNNLGTILYIGYIIGEPITTFCFQILPPAKFFSICIILWGLTVTLTALCNNYISLMFARFFLGFIESCVVLGANLMTGMWFNEKQSIRRICWWTLQAGSATIVGGFLSFCFQKINPDKTSLDSWQIFFLLMGLITIIFGIISLFVLPDNVTSCKFLNDYEKILILENIRLNQTGTENKKFKPDKLRELLFLDKHTWPMLFLTLISMIPTGAVLTFSVSMISNIGFNSQHSALMQMPLGLTTIITIVMGTYICSYFNGKHRNLIFISMLIPAIVGYIILLTCHNKVGLLIGVYLINVGTCVITMIYSWNNTNTANATKRLFRNCLTMIFFSIGALIGPQILKKNYNLAYKVLLILTIVCIPLVLLVSFISRSENRKRDQLDQSFVDDWLVDAGTNYEFKDLSDIENIMFRYSY